MNKKEAIQYLLDNMNENSVLININIDNILNNKIDPKIIECCKLLNFTICPNGTLYDNNKQGFMGKITEKMYEDRKKYKTKMLEYKNLYEKDKKKEYEYNISKYHNLQLAKKIMLNSLYGTLSNEYCRWFNFYHAESITISGQTYIKYIDKQINLYINKLLNTDNKDYIISSDTDSVYLDLNEVVKKIIYLKPEINEITNQNEKDITIIKYLDDFCENHIQKMINNKFKELSYILNVFSPRTEMKRETIANKGIWKAKKMYILNAWNVEGVQYDKPKLKMQGIEAVRSSTPYACRENIKKAIEIIMNGDENDLKLFIEKFKKEYKTLPFEKIAFPRGVNGMNKYYDEDDIYKKGTPIHVKGSLLFNYYINKKGMSSIPKIMDGDKIKFVYLKLPNPIKDTVISVPDVLPKEFDLEKYIDRDLQFEKSFINPLKSITDTINWKLKDTESLEAFFV